MLSCTELEKLISMKRREIEREKTSLGLSSVPTTLEDEKENAPNNVKNVKNNIRNNTKSVKICEPRKRNRLSEGDDSIPPDLERYIRRYMGLPVMLKAGEYSPNNPLLKCDRDNRSCNDVFIGLGEYEERKKSLRRLRQQEYREYLDQQAKKKQEEKERLEREQRLADEREREKEIELERQRDELERERRHEARVHEHLCTVDTGTQCNGRTKPLSVAVQTEESEFVTLPKLEKPNLTQAERELSPRTVLELPNDDERPIRPAVHTDCQYHRRRSYGDHTVEDRDRTDSMSKKTNRNKLLTELEHTSTTYMPSIYDSDVIHMRNLKAEQLEPNTRAKPTIAPQFNHIQSEAAEKRQYYQQELKNQIKEQQRIKEERKAREKMLEMAEMRRLEEQLRMLNSVKHIEYGKQETLTNTINENAHEYDRKRRSLQQEIDDENATLKHCRQATRTSKSDTFADPPSQLPFYYRPIADRSNEICAKQPFSMNIPENSIFSPNYDVDSYLRKNLNPSAQSFHTKFDSDFGYRASQSSGDGDKIGTKRKHYEPSFLRRNINELIVKDKDSLPIPVLRHSPRVPLETIKSARCDSSDAMKIVEDKWKVPAVQKNILKTLPNPGGGDSVNILTQLGSIRRQLQLEQLKLDKMLATDAAT